MRRVLLVGAVVAAISIATIAASGCGLDSAGLVQTQSPGVGDGSGAPGPDGAPLDGMIDAPADASIDVGLCTTDACAVTAPAGWTLVAFSVSRADACPQGLTTADVVEASFQAPGCTCGCVQGTQPNCDTGTIAQMWDDQPSSGTCQLGNPAFATTGCTDPGWNILQGHLQLTAPAPTSGTCTSPATPDLAKLQSTDARLCTPSSGACAACTSLPPSFRTCIMNTGDVACTLPQLPTKHLVGSKANLSCSGTCGACTLTATACTGTLTFYTDTGCSSGPTSFTADGTCHPANLSIQRYQWQGAPVGVTCTAGGAPPTATMSLDGELTVCCP